MAATLGQAFDLAYRKYLQAKQTTPAKEQVKALKTKVPSVMHGSRCSPKP